MRYIVYTKLSIRNYILVFLMDRYVMLTRFFDYSEAVIFATILEYYQITYNFYGSDSLNMLPGLGQCNENVFKVIDADWYLANKLLIQFKYDNRLRVV